MTELIDETRRLLRNTALWLRAASVLPLLACAISAIEMLSERASERGSEFFGSIFVAFVIVFLGLPGIAALLFSFVIAKVERPKMSVWMSLLIVAFLLLWTALTAAAFVSDTEFSPSVMVVYALALAIFVPTFVQLARCVWAIPRSVRRGFEPVLPDRDAPLSCAKPPDNGVTGQRGVA